MREHNPRKTNPLQHNKMFNSYHRYDSCKNTTMDNQNKKRTTSKQHKNNKCTNKQKRRRKFELTNQVIL